MRHRLLLSSMVRGANVNSVYFLRRKRLLWLVWYAQSYAIPPRIYLFLWVQNGYIKIHKFTAIYHYGIDCVMHELNEQKYVCMRKVCVCVWNAYFCCFVKFGKIPPLLAIVYLYVARYGVFFSMSRRSFIITPVCVCVQVMFVCAWMRKHGCIIFEI